MYSEISVQLTSLIYILILAIVYFFKRKYNFFESKIYKILLITTLLALVLDISSVFLLENVDYGRLLPIVFSKIYFLVLTFWILIFTLYGSLNKSTIKYEGFRHFFKQKSGKFYMFTSIVVLLIILFSNISYRINPTMYYGKGVVLIYGLVLISSFYILISLIVNNKQMKKYKSWSLLVTVLLLIGTFFLQFSNSSIFIVSSGLSLITLLLYFTVENPDLKYIDELNALKVAAEEANKSKTYFLASMSHEIRTPMNAIIGLSQSILGEDLPKNIKEDVKNISKAGDILLEIVNNILDITKIDEGKTTVNLKPYNLADLVAELKNMVAITLGEKDIKFSVETIGNIPTLMMGDSVKLYQVLMNLLSNAVKYTNKGFIKLQIEAKIFGNKANLTFKVIDSGIGIKKADNEKLFRRFERLDQEQSTIQGTGLGLTITKKLLDMLGGKISFTSVYQKGTTFTVELDQEIVDKTRITNFSEYKAKKKTVDEYFDGSKYDILIVDDNLLNIKVAEKLLKPYGFNITTARSGLDCINYTKNKHFHLILLDHMMPEMDGIQTLYNMRKRVHGFDSPVVVLTANAIEGSREMYLREGFCDYLSKPINQVELDRILREQLKITDEGEEANDVGRSI